MCFLALGSDTPFDLEIVEDTGIVPLINALPRWEHRRSLARSCCS
jgi:hypothetical protein